MLLQTGELPTSNHGKRLAAPRPPDALLGALRAGSCSAHRHAMSRQYYVDPSRPVGKVVMFGGNKTGGTQADKTWVLEVDDPSEPSYKWSLIQNDGTYEMNCPSSQGYGYPSPRSSPGLAFDGKELVL